MELKPINTKKQYDQWLQWIDEQFDKKIKPNTPEGEKLQIALILIKSLKMNTILFRSLILLMYLN